MTATGLWLRTQSEHPGNSPGLLQPLAERDAKANNLLNTLDFAKARGWGSCD